MEGGTEKFSDFQRQKVFSSFPSFVRAKTLHNKGLQLPQRQVPGSWTLVDLLMLPLPLLLPLLLLLLLLLAAPTRASF